MDTLKAQLEALRRLAPQTRGRKFERFLGAIFEKDSIRHRLAFRPTGEEIDGALWWNHRTFLLEAKWWKNPVPASAIYAFKGKVDGKFDHTVGLFISMSGYSEDCVDALSHGKNLNILLFDESDIIAITEGASFANVLQEKLFAAGQTGNVYLPWSALVEATKVADSVRTDATPNEPPPLIIESVPFVVVCEGESDRLLLESLVRFAAAKKGKDAKARFLVAGGKRRMFDNVAPSLVSIMSTMIPGAVAVLIVFDTDAADPNETDRQRRRMFELLAELPPTWRVHIGAAIPEIEAWLETDHKPSIPELSQMVQTLSWEDVIKSNPEVAAIFGFILGVI